MVFTTSFAVIVSFVSKSPFIQNGCGNGSKVRGWFTTKLPKVTQQCVYDKRTPKGLYTL